MATDYEQKLEPAQDYAKRCGITVRARVEEIVRKLVPEKVRDRIDGLLDGMRQSGDGVPGPDSVHQPGRERGGVEGAPRDSASPARETAEDPEEALRKARTRALVRHARAVDAIFSADDVGRKASPEQWNELVEARKTFDKVRPHGWDDAEAAYAKDPDLACEAGAGKVNRAVRALQLEAELRTDPQRSADRFVERWQKLDQASQRQYSEGDMSGYKATRAEMGNMAKRLERDPQLAPLRLPIASHSVPLIKRNQWISLLRLLMTTRRVPLQRISLWVTIRVLPLPRRSVTHAALRLRLQKRQA